MSLAGFSNYQLEAELRRRGVRKKIAVLCHSRSEFDSFVHTQPNGAQRRDFEYIPYCTQSIDYLKGSDYYTFIVLPGVFMQWSPENFEEAVEILSYRCRFSRQEIDKQERVDGLS